MGIWRAEQNLLPIQFFYRMDGTEPRTPQTFGIKKNASYKGDTGQQGQKQSGGQSVDIQGKVTGGYNEE
jgi:hypothetical protein